MNLRSQTYIAASLALCLSVGLFSCSRFGKKEDKTAVMASLPDTNPCGGEDNLRTLKFTHNVDTIYSWFDEDAKLTRNISADPLTVEANFIINSDAEYDQLKQNWRNRSAAGKDRTSFPEIDFTKSTLIACKILAPSFSYPDNIEIKKDCPGFELRVSMRPPIVTGSAYTASNYYAVVPKLPDSVKVEMVSYRAD
jgi:hypothetical protein